jgi:hypothetical protein
MQKVKPVDAGRTALRCFAAEEGTHARNVTLCAKPGRERCGRRSRKTLARSNPLIDNGFIYV